MSSCFDCINAQVKRDRLICNRSGKDVENRSSVCSKFADTSCNTCDDCEYYQFGAFSKWNDHGKCKRTGKSRRDTDVACAFFTR